MAFRIAIDTGGTFTDIVLTDENGNTYLGKAPTTYGRIFDGINGALAVIADQLHTNPSEVLRRTDLLIYGTTHATNAIIEGKIAKTAFLVTEGFPEILLLREGGKLDPFDLTTAYPRPFVPRKWTFEIRERIDSEGEIETPFDARQARSVIAELRKHGIEAVAVCFLWSPLNPAHEAAMGQILREELPGVAVTLSHQLNPIIREYRRASSAVIDASLKPLMQEHLRGMDSDLQRAGFQGELLVATSFGGVMHLSDVVEKPIYLVKSGPSMAPVAGLAYARAEAVSRDIIVCDTGGTSFDVSLVRDGAIKFTRETWLGGKFTGHLTGLSSVDVESIGAGGGSIGWIDSGGLLRVGPQSAGSEPGPACYARGGKNATVTDAAVVLGYIDPAYFLGGRMKLDVEAARSAVDQVAQTLGINLEAAASNILEVASELMVGAIKDITINQGIDPRDGLIVAGGGAAGLNIVPIARELGCSQVLVPKTAGALSACGGQFSNIVTDFSASKLAHTADFPYSEVNRTLAAIGELIEAFADRLRKKGLSDFLTEYFVEARYPYQVWELDVALAKGRFDGRDDLRRMIEDFHKEHARVFTVNEPDQQLECIYWRGRLTARLKSPPQKRLGDAAIPEPAARHTTQAYFSASGRIETKRYLGSELPAGMIIKGPAIIDEATTTVVIYPNSFATVTPLGNYLLTIA
ncbi:MAG TPA: hydantoinase/oxoprolinase family protein [Candidatus Binataceae bacterium]|nr:hydantoinase/oxoprolinase family protein [Candidatus Binataceae bacterium]